MRGPLLSCRLRKYLPLLQDSCLAVHRQAGVRSDDEHDDEVEGEEPGRWY